MQKVKNLPTLNPEAPKNIPPSIFLEVSERHSAWMNLQSRYDLDVAEDVLSGQVIREVHPLMVVG